MPRASDYDAEGVGPCAMETDVKKHSYEPIDGPIQMSKSERDTSEEILTMIEEGIPVGIEEMIKKSTLQVDCFLYSCVSCTFS